MNFKSTNGSGLKAKDPSSKRTLGKGIEVANGQFLSEFDFKCLELMGCDIDKLYELLMPGHYK